MSKEDIKRLVRDRQWFWQPNLGASYDGDGSDLPDPTPVHEDYAEKNLVGSILREDINKIGKDSIMHKPVIDLDFEADLVPSSTPGHYHLYLHKDVTWKDYKRLLRALKMAGLIEEGYFNASLQRGSTFVRPPGQKKEGDSTSVFLEMMMMPSKQDREAKAKISAKAK